MLPTVTESSTSRGCDMNACPKVECGRCGREVRTTTPLPYDFGNGLLHYYVRKHKNPLGIWCSGSTSKPVPTMARRDAS